MKDSFLVKLMKVVFWTVGVITFTTTLIILLNTDGFTTGQLSSYALTHLPL